MASVVPVLAYRDPMAAIHWLRKAFGLEITTLITDAKNEMAHCVMNFKGEDIGVMREWGSPELLGSAEMKSPASVGGVGTQFLRVELADLRAHCETARAAGARIVQEPQDQPYGDRTYRALDLEGHVWNFHEPIAEVPAATWEREMGLKDRTAEYK
jgi:uncharacterized glyoxalase superfamily protein PhnB